VHIHVKYGTSNNIWRQKQPHMEVGWEGLKRTPGGCAAARLTISEGGVAATYSVYLRGDIRLIFQSADRSRAELAARLLRLAGVGAEVKRMSGVWRVQAYTDMLAAGRGELRRALAEVVREAATRGLVDGRRAERWLKKLEKGSASRRPKYLVRLTHSGSLEVRFASTSPHSIRREAQRLEEIGLKRGIHFTVKMPGGGRDGYVRILREGLAHAAWLSVYGSEERRELARELVKHLLQRAGAEGGVYEKARKIVEEGRARGSLTLKGFEERVEVGSVEREVKVVEWRVEESRRGRALLRVEIAAEVDGVGCRFAVAFGRYGKKGEVAGYARAKASAPGGREADAERIAAVVKALAGDEPRMYRRNGAIIIVCGRRHLEGLRRFAELADAVERWLNSR
jgi:hypothetical protein